MGVIDRIILIKNAVETLGYFSEQMAEELESAGMSVYWIDYDNLAESAAGIRAFAQRETTALVTFNFIGLSGEAWFLETDGTYIWEKESVYCLNILVDHPVYFQAKIEHLSVSRMEFFCIDREHVSYIRRFYPELSVDFLPLAGNRIQPRCADGASSVLPTARQDACYQNRRYDLVFTGNYTPPDFIYEKIAGLDSDYRQFYLDIIDDLKASPEQSVDRVMETHIRRELGSVPDRDLRGAMIGMILVDICIRSIFRGEIIKTLVDGGIQVHTFGTGWEMLSCKKPENLISNGGQTDSAFCAAAVGNAKISLNIMPWFKDGIHDRVLTAMIQNTVSLTDTSRYLCENFKDKTDLICYELQNAKALPDLVNELLRQPEQLEEIAQNGYNKASLHHTWRNRTDVLLEKLINLSK